MLEQAPAADFLTPGFYAATADGVLVLHALIVFFCVFMLPLVFIGGWLNWRWVRRLWLRLAHVALILVVALQSTAGFVCPLTTLESALRQHAGQEPYAMPFVAHWLRSLIFFQAPSWLFTVAYWVFAGLILLSWFWVRPAGSLRHTPKPTSLP